MKLYPLLLTAITLCLAPFACTVEDDPGEPTGNDAAQLEQAAEVTELAIADYLDCRAEHPDACASEEEDLVEALRDLELVDDDDGFRASAIANCTGRQPVSCVGPGTCYATDDVGCACQNNGVLSVVRSCAESPTVSPPPPPPPGNVLCGGSCPAGTHCCSGECLPNNIFCP